MKGNLTDEYLDTSANMRQYGNMRFAQLTLFVAITAGLLNMVFVSTTPLSQWAKLALEVSGGLVGIAFWIMEERAARYFHNYRRRAVELEKVLGFKQHTTRSEGKFVTSANAVRVLFAAMILFWVLSLVLRF